MVTTNPARTMIANRPSAVAFNQPSFTLMWSRFSGIFLGTLKTQLSLREKMCCLLLRSISGFEAKARTEADL